MASYLALEVRGMVLAVLEVRLSKITAETRVWKDLEDGAALIHILVKDMTNEKGASELEAVKVKERVAGTLFLLVVV